MNAINWFEIPVTDFARARQFYESILATELKLDESFPGMRIALFPGDKSCRKRSCAKILVSSACSATARGISSACIRCTDSRIVQNSASCIQRSLSDGALMTTSTPWNGRRTSRSTGTEQSGNTYGT